MVTFSTLKRDMLFLLHIHLYLLVREENTTVLLEVCPYGVHPPNLTKDMHRVRSLVGEPCAYFSWKLKAGLHESENGRESQIGA